MALFRLEIQISVLAPYATVKYLKYFKQNGETKIEYSNNPFLEEHIMYQTKVNNFITDSKLTILDDKQLMLEVPEIRLEIREEKASVYNCLFEDCYSYYPYLDEE